MHQEFVYPPRLARATAESGAAMARYAVWFAAGWWIAGLGFLFLHDPPTWTGLPIAALMTTGALFFRRAHQRLIGRFADFEGQRIVADGDWVRQLDARGAELGRIDLRESFQVRHGAVLNGNAILEVTQPGDAASFGAPRRIEFATCLQDGERLVRDVFRSRRWPKSRGWTRT